MRLVRGGRGERGAVTAELAMGLPLLVAMTVALAWLLSLATAQVRVTDAARETARAVARGDDEGAAVAAGRRVGPDGTRIRVTRQAGQVVVRAESRVPAPAGLLARWRGVLVDADAVALDEAEP